MNQNIDKLTQDERDAVQCAFSFCKNDFGLPFDALEIRLDNVLKNLIDGGAGFLSHSLGNTEHYLKHLGDPEWAIIFANTEIGDIGRGKAVIAKALDEEWG